MCMRASGASELRKFWYFYIPTLLFLSIFCRYSRYSVGTNDMLVGLHVPTNFLIYRQTLTLSKCVYATERSESSLENFGIFTFLICYFFQYFVGTSDTLSVQMTCLSAHMYRQISKCTDKFPSVPTKIRKSIIGGAAAPPAPPLATLMPPPPGGLKAHFRQDDGRSLLDHCGLRCDF